MYRTILVPLDGSAVSEGILEQVITLARGYGAHLILLTVGYPVPSWATSVRTAPSPSTFAAETYLLRIRERLRAQGLTVSTAVCIGDPATEILDYAERHGADLIIIASRGGGGTPLPFLGSVALKVAGASSVPVLVLHASQRKEP